MLLKSIVLVLIVSAVSINGQTNSIPLTAAMFASTPGADPSFPFANAIDGNATSCAATTAQTLTINLGASFLVNNVAITTTTGTVVFAGGNVTVGITNMNGNTTQQGLAVLAGSGTSTCTTVSPGTASTPFATSGTGSYTCNNVASTVISLSISNGLGLVCCEIKVFSTDTTTAATVTPRSNTTVKDATHFKVDWKVMTVMLFSAISMTAFKGY